MRQNVETVNSVVQGFQYPLQAMKSKQSEQVNVAGDDLMQLKDVGTVNIAVLGPQ